MSSGSSSGKQLIEGTRRRRGPSIPSVIGAEATDMMNAILKETESKIMRIYEVVYRNSDIDVDTNVQHICRIMADENEDERDSKMSKGNSSGLKKTLTKKSSQMAVPRTPLSLLTMDELHDENDLKTERKKKDKEILVTESEVSDLVPKMQSSV